MDVNEASVDPDPITQLSRWLEIARSAGEPMAEAMAVATATTDGRPSCRMVLLREIDDRGVVFYTDRESDKGRELSSNPLAARSSIGCSPCTARSGCRERWKRSMTRSRTPTGARGPLVLDAAPRPACRAR